VPQAFPSLEKTEEVIRQMSIVWVALCLAGGALVLSTATLLIAFRVWQSAKRSERAGGERLEILREQQQRLEFLREERHLLVEELQRQRSRLEERLKEKPSQEGDEEEEEVVEQPAERSAGQTGGNPEATDAAKQKAEELGVDLWQVEGSGTGGRIIATDVQSAANRGMTRHRG
jgi:pyruvate/2-oxoglutarate dehydrogenase complex dihydrolipoamide acyltransferase (E2) component